MMSAKLSPKPAPAGPAPEAELRRMRILLVDDDVANTRLLERMLREAGYQEVFAVNDSAEALAAFRSVRPDLVLLDLLMPPPDGFEILAAIRGCSGGDYMPVLVLTGDLSEETSERSLATGASDFLTKPFRGAEVLLRIRNLLANRLLYRELRAQNESLEGRVRERTLELVEARNEVLNRLARAAEYRDDETGRHAERVGLLSAAIGREMGLEAGLVELIYRAAPLHDLGKIGLPDSILHKPAALDARENAAQKLHTRIGSEILSGSPIPELCMAAEIALAHHERWDGTGYPAGLTGEEIPLAARIVAVADVFDALVHERPYKPAWPLDAAVTEIRRQRGVQFDPAAVDALERVLAAGKLPEGYSFS